MAHARLVAQGVAAAGRAATPADVVSHLVAVQAQEPSSARWGVGLRARGPLHEADVGAGLDVGGVVRTHVLRPTWHLVAAADVRWLLALTAPRVHAANAPYYRRTGLDAATLARTDEAICRALEDGPRTRDELRSAVAACGVAAERTEPMALAVMHAELEGLVCSGPACGSRPRYVLMDRRVPPGPPRDPVDARAELARRYATSRGPVTARDLAWWSGLTLSDARRGLADAGDALRVERIDGADHWSAADPPPCPAGDATHLLPAFDELLVGYADRSAMSGGRAIPAADLLGPVVVDHGTVVATWRRRLRAGAVEVAVTPYAPVPGGARERIEAAAAVFAAFSGGTARMVWNPPAVGRRP